MAKRKTTKSHRKTQIGLFSFTGIILFIGGILFFFTEYESYESLYDAEYVGSATCGKCHIFVYEEWKQSPHAKMTRHPSAESVVGNFDQGSYTLPAQYQTLPEDDQPAMKTYTENGDYFMALRDPQTGNYQPFKVDYVIGYQYRQTYLTLEPGGVLRRLPLEWSVKKQEFFPYWNFQEGSTPSHADFWAQMTSLNSAWNLFCARCHTTNLNIVEKNSSHTYAETFWTDDGIACEACHGPGSQHTNYFENNYINRIVAFANSNLRGEPAAYIAMGPKLPQGEDMSVCARCHGPDIMMSTTDIYRIYEPGYSREGKINDLSPWFKQIPLTPGRTDPTVETWMDARPKGIAMIFRGFIESKCYAMAEVRCYDCHNPHNNKVGTYEDILQPSKTSNGYCLRCHGELSEQIAEHTHHTPEEAGSYCYDCHMPHDILNLATGVARFTRGHTMSHIPNPQSSVQYGLEGAPNACNECHSDQTPEWAVEQYREWWGEPG